MTGSTIRPIVEAFYDASVERDIDRAMSFVADDVEWILQGPVDIFAFCGLKRGKAAVLEGYDEIARRLQITAYMLESLLVDGDRAAAMIRLTSLVRSTGKIMSVRTTQFSRWRDGKIVDMRAVCDTYDMVEQTIGRPLDLAPLELESIPA